MLKWDTSSEIRHSGVRGSVLLNGDVRRKVSTGGDCQGEEVSLWAKLKLVDGNENRRNGIASFF